MHIRSSQCNVSEGGDFKFTDICRVACNIIAAFIGRIFIKADIFESANLVVIVVGATGLVT